MTTSATIDPDVRTLHLETLALQINEQHQAFETVCGHALSHAYEAGVLLGQAKAELDHGQWGEWVDENLRFGIREAQRYMRVAENHQVLKATGVSHLGLEAQLRQIRAPRQKPATASDVGEMLREAAGPPSAPPESNPDRYEPTGGVGVAPGYATGDETLPAYSAGSVTTPDQPELTAQQDNKLARVQELFNDAAEHLREVERPLSGYARAALTREAAIITRRAASMLDELAAGFDR